MIYPLCTLKPGQRGKVHSVRICGAMRQRLSDIGLTPGTEVECVLKPVSGEPTAYYIRGALTALRFEDASRIFVKPIS